MKEDGRVRNRGNVRSAVEKERTKMRERQRRSITTKIFHGLRQHGGYRLSPRADINQVLRHLAQEAGWELVYVRFVVEEERELHQRQQAVLWEPTPPLAAENVQQRPCLATL
ncbi:BES1/BZR1-like protein 4 [Forsythia ovata]|uniref:Protein BZR1 homolog n=1 Tax=Forsythia ovata TaxID=205694 RepID=A0ABD1S518_9LAMI